MQRHPIIILFSIYVSPGTYECDNNIRMSV